MSESKELLEATIKGLEEKLESVKSDLGDKVRELEDAGKPEMTEEMYDTLGECVREGIDKTAGNLENDDMEVEFGMECDGQVYLESIYFNDTDSMGDKIMEEVNKKFKIVEDE